MKDAIQTFLMTLAVGFFVWGIAAGAVFGICLMFSWAFGFYPALYSGSVALGCGILALLLSTVDDMVEEVME